MFDEFFAHCKPADEVKPSKKRVSKNIAAVRSLIDSETEGISMTDTKRKIRMKPLIIAAAIAAVALLAGFTTTAFVNGKHTFIFSNGKSVEQGFELELKSRELTIPEEFNPQDGDFFFGDVVDMTPRELCEKFGVPLPINDNFDDVADEKPDVFINRFDGDTDIRLNFVLYNKTVDTNVYFKPWYCSYNDDLSSDDYHYELNPGEPTEVVTLNNGAKCLVSAHGAVFSYDGALWRIGLDYDDTTPDNYGELTEKEQQKIRAEMVKAMPGIDAVKLVLADMELL